MKNSIHFLWIILIFTGCKKDPVLSGSPKNIAGIKAGVETEVFNLKMNESTYSSTNVDCYVFGSSVFDSSSSSFGYVSCDSIYTAINLLTGEFIHSYPLPGLLSQMVIDPSHNALIGLHSDSIGHYLTMISMEDGQILSQNTIDLLDGVLACTYFFNPSTSDYVLVRADSSMVSVDPETGTISSTIQLQSILNDAVYDQDNNRLIGMVASQATNQQFIQTIDVASGVLLSSIELAQMQDYYGCESDYDDQTNSYLIISPENMVLFIDVETGQIIDSYQLDFRPIEFKFWRNN